MLTRRATGESRGVGMGGLTVEEGYVHGPSIRFSGWPFDASGKRRTGVVRRRRVQRTCSTGWPADHRASGRPGLQRRLRRHRQQRQRSRPPRPPRHRAAAPRRNQNLIIDLDQSDVKTLDPGREFEFAAAFIDPELLRHARYPEERRRSDHLRARCWPKSGRSRPTARSRRSTCATTSSSPAATRSRRTTSSSA